MKFEDAYNKYLIFIDNKQKQQSKKTLKERFNKRILPYWKDYDIYNINEFDYINWQNSIEELNFSYNYKNGLHYLISGFFEFCILYLGMKQNIASKVGPFKLGNKTVTHDFYTLKEYKRFIKNVDNEVYKQFFNLMYYTGTRPGEAMALKFSDLNYKCIYINKTISEHTINGSRVIDDPKTTSSFRYVNIDRKLYKDLLRLKKLYNKKYSLKDFDYYIFGGIKPLAPTSINRHKKNACKKANLRPIKLHEYRHSHASLLYNYKIPMQAIKERLGHANINTTMGIYVHLTKRQEKRVSYTLSFLRLL